MAIKAVCYVCGKESLSRNEIGLNQKLIGLNVKTFHCMQCLADYLDLSIEELEERMQDFKDAGCVLFE